ncbi:hypothetical protein SCH4B_0260 [Ruegeria sp. TrichCH4B]|nr:hypothetical protein SCH4B_0260 [Ruegeria sp. TrichCH4B]
MSLRRCPLSDFKELNLCGQISGAQLPPQAAPSAKARAFFRQRQNKN